jgi:hypothetical protein
VTVSWLGNLSQVGILVVGIFFLIWFHKAATLSRALGRPARRSPGWAVAGFLIPIVNFWFPYQSAIDMVPPGHPATDAVKRWWALWLTMSLMTFPIMAGMLLAPAVGWVLAIVGVGVVVLATSAAQRVVAAITEAQEQMAGQRLHR